MSDFKDSLRYKCSVFFLNNKDAFQLQLHCDEFETVNLLGSKTGGHKLGAIYLSIRNLPGHFNSSLVNIHLVALFYSSDVKTFGLNSVLDIAVNDLRILETTGVYDDRSKSFIRGTIVALSHDNLGGNQLHGMVESFSATHFCRICIADKHVCQRMSIQNDDLLRNDQMYENYCTQLHDSGEAIVYGLKSRSSLNNLNHFKLCANPSVDIMDDLLEDIIQLEIKLFLKFFISVNLQQCRT